MNLTTQAPAHTVPQAITAPQGIVSHVAASVSAAISAVRSRWAAFAYTGQLGPTADREVGRWTGGRI